MIDLSDRQIKIIRAVVEEYSKTAEPVGSDTLDRRYNLGVSPATIRNEMAYLVELNYLNQPHTSAGRVPTPKAIKLYIDELMKEKNLTVAEEVSAKEKLWENRAKMENLLRQATKELARRTNSIGVAVTDEMNVYHSGYAYILDLPEFFDIDVTRTVLSMLDEAQELVEILRKAQDNREVHILLGDDFDVRYMDPVSIVYSEFSAGQRQGAIGVIGSCRADYPYIVPLVRHFSQLIKELVNA